MIEVEVEQIQECVSRNGYEFEKLLGYGPDSSVSICKSKNCQQQFVVKRVTKQKMTTDEYDALVSLNHPNIISLYNTFEDEDAQYFVMEYCSNGTMKEKSKISSEKFIHYAKEMIDAVAYCHANNIAHRDIKPENIFVDQYDHAKLGDFGSAKQIENRKKSTEKANSLIFSAPEILQHQKYCPFKADIWALGVTFFYMVIGTYPFKEKSVEELRKSIIYGELDFGNRKINPQIRYLINKMTTKNPNARPSADKLLKLPLFQSEAAKKTPYLAGSRRNSYGFGLNSSSNFFLNKSMTFEQNQPETTSDQQNPILLNEVHCYRSAAVHPSFHRIGSRYQFGKPN